MVEAVEVVGEPDRVGREKLRAAPAGASRTVGGNSTSRFTSSRSSGASGPGGAPPTCASPALRRIAAIRACAYWT